MEYYEYDGITAAIDEVGRGPLAGPVVAACVILPQELAEYITGDSKKISAKKRAELSSVILQNAKYGFGIVSSKEIDEMNILNATMLAMQRSYENMNISSNIVLIDGNKAPKMPVKTEIFIGGDARITQIAAASIIAKVYRDDIMQKLGAEHPEYGFEKHAGYGTKQHLEAIQKFGPIAEHRKSFAPIKHFYNEEE